MDWIYNVPMAAAAAGAGTDSVTMMSAEAVASNAAAQASADEYALGKVVKIKEASAGGVFELASAGGHEARAAAGPKTAKLAQLDAEAKLRDDPLMLMLRREHEAKLEVLNNPVRMAQIREKVRWPSDCRPSFTTQQFC